MTVVVFGAGGIIGQEMIHCAPEHPAIYTNRSGGGAYAAFDAESESVNGFLDRHAPDVVVNLMGENRVDVVESDPESHRHVNVKIPEQIAWWCGLNKARLVHVSTQGIFSGENAPYSPHSSPHPITEYGKQKREAELAVIGSSARNLIIARLTFVIGVRREDRGRKNPLESMFEDSDQIQVDDRFFSPVWSVDAARILWELVESDRVGIVHVGEPVKCSRYTLACEAAWGTLRNVPIQAASHRFFKGIAPRPRDTTWSREALYYTHYQTAILESYIQWRQQRGDKSVER